MKKKEMLRWRIMEQGWGVYFTSVMVARNTLLRRFKLRSKVRGKTKLTTLGMMEGILNQPKIMYQSPGAGKNIAGSKK